MNKDEWQKTHSILTETYNDFQNEYSNYLKGRNKKIRDKAQQTIESAISTANVNIVRKQEVYDLLTGGEGVSDYGRAIAYDEFVQPRYFVKDMPRFLEKIEKKINSFD